MMKEIAAQRKLNKNREGNKKDPENQSSEGKQNQATCGWAFLVSLVLCGEQVFKMTVVFIKGNDI